MIDARWIVPLSQCTQPELSGAKAFRLGQMAKLGYRTPPGHVLLEPLRQAHLARCGLAAEAAALEQRILTATSDELIRRSAALHAAIVGKALDPDLRQALAALYRRHWRDKVLAIRSSAYGEDSAGHSFAGQLDSFLGIHSLEDLESAIRRTWASLWTQRCVLYQRHKRLPLRAMGVIVQEQVDARFSGVLFTQPPARVADFPVVLAEYCAGLGEALVSGELTPGQILFDRRHGDIVRHVPAPGALAGDDILAQQPALKQLAQAALALERELDVPLDIEWSIGQDGKLYLLQARPITTAAPPRAREIVWTNANIAENFPEPVTPFLYSIAVQGYAAYFRNLGVHFGVARTRIAAMQDVIDRLIGVHGGRLYYNLTNIHTVLYLAPAGRWLTRFFNEFVGATAFPAPHQAAAPGVLGRAAECLRIPFKTAWQYLWIKRRIRNFERRVDNYCNATQRTQLRHKSLSALREDLHGFLDIRLNRWNGAALADTAAMITYGLLKLVLARTLPKEDSAGLHNDLLKGLCDIASSAPVKRLWELSRQVRRAPELHRLFSEDSPDDIWRKLNQAPEFFGFLGTFLDYLENWGFRSSGELLLTVPSPQERPQETLALLKLYVGRSGPAPDELLRVQAAARAQLTQDVLTRLTPPAWRRRLPFAGSAWWAAWLLRATQGAIRLRERARFRQARLYVHLRHVVLAAGELLRQNGTVDAPEDLFFLTAAELDELLAGQSMFPRHIRDLIARRQQWHRDLSRLAPPDHFTLAAGSYWGDGRESPSAVAPQAPDGRRLQGAAACGGRVTAGAVVLQSAAQGHTLQEGDILVTRQTDPGWASVFFLVRGLVVERGGMLSHGAIIAREYGIPAVIGVAGATQAIRTGNRLCVDGDHGVVDIL